MQLESQAAPNTVDNFLAYVHSGAYNNTFIHRSVSNFVIQSGGYILNDDLTARKITSLGNIINEYSISNIEGTVAMAKLGGDPDSATSEWFINLSDNADNLDNQNGGFTVFASVIDSDMSIVEQFASYTSYSIGSGATSNVFSSTPLKNYASGNSIQKENFVLFSQATQVPSYSENLLDGVVDVDDGRHFRVKMQMISASPITIQLEMQSIEQVNQSSEQNMRFDANSASLTIPSLFIDASVRLNQLVFNLSDAATFQFVLSSIDGIAYAP